MRINKDHLYHGAALTQIAEHPEFTAINAFKIEGVACRSAFKVNDDIGAYLKYATKPTRPFGEYVFTFHASHLRELGELVKRVSSVFLVLVCVKDREICSFHYRDFKRLVERRRVAKGSDEEQYTLLVAAPKGRSLRVYVNAPGQRRMILGDEILIPRSAFPNVLFRRERTAQQAYSADAVGS
ncbi:hypothetical protein [Limnochorda pilosa]|uniref:Uncharacterized protein n=1 Tax=Limnochorda pilosa TaxID=1555112 RepID=A0A0K2SI22_LIMPI|nr:hypothetical protein [Limnochorda pilosa]BAS26753.1 hypothetical protein LIP_0896 [Limnochorda pilosa]